MNILVPDNWLREYLITKATPEEIKKYLSLCGPSVERIHKAGTVPVYEIEITGNRPDAMSVIGVAREAAAILPRFKIKAELKGDPYKLTSPFPSASDKLKFKVKADQNLVRRFTSIVFDEVKIGPSPAWLSKYLEMVGVRSINNVIDITNYLMHAYGQPSHVFDYDAIADHTMILRASRKGEKVKTLDGKDYTLPGDDIVIEDGSGKLIDLCGIMGGENSSVKPGTKRVILFVQTYNPVKIRRTMMNLGVRTEAGSLFEKDLDPELVYPVFIRGIKMMRDLTGAKMAGKIIDIYDKPVKNPEIKLTNEKLITYLGIKLGNPEIKSILGSLGFKVSINAKNILVNPPSYRRDVKADVDVIEEIARIYGYRNIKTAMPSGEIPDTAADAELNWEYEIKTRLRDWGYTEMITYSMISESLIDLFGFDKTKTYKIANPLTSDWVYMRPELYPGFLTATVQNQGLAENLQIFELGMKYVWNPGGLPHETPVLIVAWQGENYARAKGLAETILKDFGIDINSITSDSHNDLYGTKSLNLGIYGILGEINDRILSGLGMKLKITCLYLDLGALVKNADFRKTYIPIPKYPASFEDLTFTLPENHKIGKILTALKKTDPLVYKAELKDSYKNNKTFHITYLDPVSNLTDERIRPVHMKLIKVMESEYNAILKA